ncbi:PREDICTED: protein-L-isoaspartate O-methyltransferase domain-containing protein 1-like isoform X1 [Habropoda laboriosa]|uniref:protein-L-isoaspartate O-methyltransferase domain-containing protein 1-like isoform X1 n=1 Tax=Habropoda laboriosa TaxID=597456 RepID=UPI00083E534B|nr:PREDICTED: protein-L-isoaspartate O-methyltransferase domain-containing protein 1-like isoform X1 [Habropoda laboriosa]
MQICRDQRGTNHDIELHKDCLKYAHDELEEFKQKSLTLDLFNFYIPVLIEGTCLNVVPGRQCDRVYCNTTCFESQAFVTLNIS